METIANGTITTPQGFLAGSVFAGIKTKGKDMLDLGVLYSEAPCTIAGVFTTNRIKAAPVILCQRRLSKKTAQALVVNSGCANACTGERGLADAEEMASLAARKLGLEPNSVLVASTGVIGERLKVELIAGALEGLALSKEGGHGLAKAIMTTDTRPKEIAVTVNMDGRRFTIGGVAKGAGMIHPNMATMLSFLTTDAPVEAGFLQAALCRAVDTSFNMITIDGETSPNDTVLIMANGVAGGGRIEKGSSVAGAFRETLEEVCNFLARSIASDGEGATKLIEVVVEGAASVADARAAARAIASSPLVKAAVYGSDPNWGRVIAALGRSGVELEESRIDLDLNGFCVMRGGYPQPFDRERLRAVMGNPEVTIRVGLNLGRGAARSWGCDLSEEYVIINSAYST